MISKYPLMVLVIAVLLSCSKNAANKRDTFIVSARKMIDITSNDWSNTEPQLNDKTGYQYAKSPDNLSNVIKAEVHLPAIDDRNRAINGTILLNIAPENKVFQASFSTEPSTKTAAYAMMLNYNNESLRTLTGISSSIGEVIEDGRGENTTVEVVLSKVNSGQEANQLVATYNSGQGKFTMGVFKQNDGHYIFSYRGNR